MENATESTGTLEVALSHTRRLLETDAARAAEQAGEILKAAPNHPMAMLLLGVARRKTGNSQAALQSLQPLVATQPTWAIAHYELGLALEDGAQPVAALAALRRAVALRPNMPDAWRAIGDNLTVSGDVQGADAAYAQHIKASTQDPKLLVAASALVEGRIAQAEALLRAHLKQHPTDVVAILMLAEVAARLGRNADAESLLESCLELAPSFSPARHQYAIVLHRQNKSAAALRQIDELAKFDPRNATHRNLKAAVLVKIGEYQQSIEIYDEVLGAHPEHPKLWLSYGHALATAGRDQDSVAAYRKSIQLAPHFGEAYWSLANLKTFRFSVEEVHAMQSQLGRGDLAEEDRYHLDFAMGKALEDDGNYSNSFTHYFRANELRRTRVNYDGDEMAVFVRESKLLFNAEFFDVRTGYGALSADPIFIVGMPRAGSTLVEQILASHSRVEGTMELPDIITLAASLSGKKVPNAKPRYPSILGELDAAACRELGERYLSDTRIQRKTAKPLFIDKMPNNFLHIGLIRLALPNAKIIDARRHPMACCFSSYKQQFTEGHRYSYSLADIGRFYRDYVELMDHFDRATPGKVHRIYYENMIDDTEAEVRRLLSYCGLPFESACLRFYENQRPVRTPSSRQVRQPVDHRFRGTFGLFYQRQTDNIRAAFQTNDLPTYYTVDGSPNTIYLSQQDRTDRDYAVFGDMTFDVTSQFNVSAGIRQFWVENTLFGFFGFNHGQSGEGSCNPPASAATIIPNYWPCVNTNKKVVENGETHRVNLTYQIDPDHMVYGTYSTGFRPGGNNRRVGVASYSDDTLTNFEIGWKTAWFDQRLRANGAVFYEKWNGVQLSVTGANGITSIVNVGNATVKGVESQLEWLPIERLSISASATYVNARTAQNFCNVDQVTEEITHNCPNPNAPSGTQLPVTPKIKSAATARYKFNVGSYQSFVQGTVVHQGSSTSNLDVVNNAAMGDLPKFTTLDLASGTGLNNWKVEAFIENVFDKRGQLGRINQCANIYCYENYRVYPIKPMQFGVRFGQKF